MSGEGNEGCGCGCVALIGCILFAAAALDRLDRIIEALAG